jgi:hypothetical protein
MTDRPSLVRRTLIPSVCQFSAFVKRAYGDRVCRVGQLLRQGPVTGAEHFLFRFRWDPCQPSSMNRRRSKVRPSTSPVTDVQVGYLRGRVRELRNVREMMEAGSSSGPASRCLFMTLRVRRSSCAITAELLRGTRVYFFCTARLRRMRLARAMSRSSASSDEPWR